MDRIRIRGGRPLHGEIVISGAKNAGLPLMAAGLLTDERLVLTRVPLLADIHTMASLLEQHGIAVERPTNDGRVLSLGGPITNTEAPYDIVRKMRASILVLGPLLARTREARVSLPGGCAIGTRPVDLHLKGLEQMGATIKLDGGYIDAAGLSFRDFIDGRLAPLYGEKPTVADWKDHLSTAFPEVRLKGYLEMRGADGGRWDRICALPALWVGLLYDGTALDAAWDLCKGWSHADHARLRDEVPRLALKASSPNGGTLQDLAKEVLKIADTGLAARARLNGAGDSEPGFLGPLHEIAASGLTNADRMLEAYHGRWGGDVSAVYAEDSY